MFLISKDVRGKSRQSVDAVLSGLTAMIVDNALSERKKLIWRGGSPALSSRLVPEERGVALTYGGSTYAVMMATPADLEDFGIGFSVTEGIVQKADEIRSLDLVENDFGMKCGCGSTRIAPKPSLLGAELSLVPSVAGCAASKAWSKPAFCPGR
jgi:hypothetical protein